MLSVLEIVLLSIVCVESLILLGLVAIKVAHKRSRTGVVEKNNVRYTIDDKTTTEQGEVNVSYVKEDIILVADKVYTVSKKGPIKPGKYIILSTQSGKQKVNVKVNSVARSQEHNSDIVFAEGDIVVAPNESVILR